jgi:hypothetical protein
MCIEYQRVVEQSKNAEKLEDESQRMERKYITYGHRKS